jgi:hypothetical protein
MLVSIGQRVSKDGRMGTVVHVQLGAGGRPSAKVRMDDAKRAGWYWQDELTAA